MFSFGHTSSLGRARRLELEAPGIARLVRFIGFSRNLASEALE